MNSMVRDFYGPIVSPNKAMFLGRAGGSIGKVYQPSNDENHPTGPHRIVFRET